MALYEHIFLTRQDVAQPQVEALTEQIKSKLASLGGAVTKVCLLYTSDAADE